MRVVIAGTGAMAVLFGARLAPHARVTLLGTWREGIDAVNRGIEVSPGRDRPAAADAPLLPPQSEPDRGVSATADPSAIAPAALAFVLVKSWQTERAAHGLNQCLAPEGLAVTLQNGLGNLEILQARLGVERAALGTTTCGATLTGPGRVRESGCPAIQVACQPRVQAAVDLLVRAGFSVELAADARSLLWGKLIVNAAINPLTALLRVPNGELLRRPEAAALMEAAAEEAAGVARRCGVDLPYADPAARARAVAGLTADNLSSMLQDVRRGVRTEIDAINGAICREASRRKSRAPINCALWRLVRALPDAERGKR
ncbi:MAG: ketopantoate reductase family protein [Acidobacteria bacterium]|nr:ketopantoate reductase family protein [Acidobacteriota bacterium]